VSGMEPTSAGGESSAQGSPALEDRRFMALALLEAERAALHDDVPIGAVLVQAGRILAMRGNERELQKDPTAHAEMLCLRDAAAFLGGWRIPDSTLYVTLEPCAMCAGALVLARVDRLVFAAEDPKAGAAGSLMDITRDPRLNHRLAVTSGVLAEESGALLQQFFRKRRGRDQD
jgi:tRNA(adenine34) deaminase